MCYTSWEGNLDKAWSHHCSCRGCKTQVWPSPPNNQVIPQTDTVSQSSQDCKVNSPTWTGPALPCRALSACRLPQHLSNCAHTGQVTSNVHNQKMSQALIQVSADHQKGVILCIYHLGVRLRNSLRPNKGPWRSPAPNSNCWEK